MCIPALPTVFFIYYVRQASESHKKQTLLEFQCREGDYVFLTRSLVLSATAGFFLHKFHCCDRRPLKDPVLTGA